MVSPTHHNAKCDCLGACSMCWAREPDIAHLSTFGKYSWSVMKGLSTTVAAGAAYSKLLKR